MPKTPPPLRIADSVLTWEPTGSRGPEARITQVEVRRRALARRAPGWAAARGGTRLRRAPAGRPLRDPAVIGPLHAGNTIPNRDASMR